MAVAFDVDGTLYPAAAFNSRALPLVLRHPLLFAAFGKARRDIRAAARADARGRPADATTFRRRQAEITAALLGARKVDRVAELIDDVVYRGVTELFAGLRLYRGLVPALDALAEAGLRLAVLSDLPPLRKLSLMGLDGRFERALCSEDSGFLKPAPEPFRMLGDALHLEPRSILYVGNSKAYDLEGARAAGMEAAIVSRGRVPGAALSFTEWDRLVELATS